MESSQASMALVQAEKSTQLGDRVRIGEACGGIDHIGLRSAKLTTPDDTRLTIPNSAILSREVFPANSGVLAGQVVPVLVQPGAARRLTCRKQWGYIRHAGVIPWIAGAERLRTPRGGAHEP